MQKLTALEMERIQEIQKSEQELVQMKSLLGDITVQLELVKTQTLQKQVEVSKTSQDLKDSLAAKYGKDFRIQEDGTVVLPENEVETVETEEI